MRDDLFSALKNHNNNDQIRIPAKRGEDGQLHGPINKKIWGQFGKRKDAIAWAREQATRRGFGPETDKLVQIVIDGERCLRQQLQEQFPRAILTLDLRHAQ